MNACIWCDPDHGPCATHAQEAVLGKLREERDEARAEKAMLRIALENAVPVEAERDLLRAENRQLRAALRRIEDPKNWGNDGGWVAASYPDEIAREALGE